MSFLKRLFGREEKKPEKTEARGMHRHMFMGLVSVSMAELRQKAAMLEAEWQLSKIESMELDQIGGMVRWSYESGLMLEAPMQLIGVLDTEKDIWTWAWAHPVPKEALTIDAREVREWGEQNGVEKLTEGAWSATSKDAWEMTAFAASRCHARGAATAPVGVDTLFITFGEVRICEGLPMYALDPANRHDV